MEAVRRGFRLVAASWRVLMADKELLLLPVLSFLALVFVLAVFVGVGWITGALRGGGTALIVPLAAACYVLTFCVEIYFHAAVVAAATVRLRGGNPTVGGALGAAWARRWPLSRWALLAATVGMLLDGLERALQAKGRWIARLLVPFVAFSWHAISFFVVPVILFEGPTRVRSAVRRSESIFSSSWGESALGSGSICLALCLVAVPLGALVYVVTDVWPAAGVAVGVLLFGTLAAVGSALSGIFNAALYRFATTGEADEAFDTHDLADTFHARA